MKVHYIFRYYNKINSQFNEVIAELCRLKSEGVVSDQTAFTGQKRFDISNIRDEEFKQMIIDPEKNEFR